MSVQSRQRVGWSGALLVISVCSLIPVLWIVFLSLKTPASVTDGSFIPHHWTLDNYRDIFKAGVFTDALRNSIGIALISTALAVVLASAAAYAIARLEFPGKRAILAISLAVAMFPQISLVGPLYNLWRQIGLYNTWPGLIIPYMTFALPLSIYILSAFFREIPWELEQFPGVSQFTTPYGDIAAAAVVVTVPVMILVMLFQRRIVAGLTAGAVKG
jgi:multiple sugar transport system permease protein